MWIDSHLQAGSVISVLLTATATAAELNGARVCVNGGVCAGAGVRHTVAGVRRTVTG